MTIQENLPSSSLKIHDYSKCIGVDRSFYTRMNRYIWSSKRGLAMFPTLAEPLNLNFIGESHELKNPSPIQKNTIGNTLNGFDRSFAPLL